MPSHSSHSTMLLCCHGRQGAHQRAAIMLECRADDSDGGSDWKAQPTGAAAATAARSTPGSIRNFRVSARSTGSFAAASSACRQLPCQRLPSRSRHADSLRAAFSYAPAADAASFQLSDVLSRMWSCDMLPPGSNAGFTHEP